MQVLRRGLSYRAFPDGSHLDGTGRCTIYPGDGIPFTFELLRRPCASLRPGDEVADVADRAWRFDGPWDWSAFDGEPADAGPEWPLVLLTRAEALCSVEDAEAVAASTARCSTRSVAEGTPPLPTGELAPEGRRLDPGRACCSPVRRVDPLAAGQSPPGRR